jgi:nuclear transport factor 2 (NTF2) superfamily protein
VLRKSLWGFRENRIAVRFQYECHDRDGQWYRSYGNELWEFADNGLMRRREASVNDVPIAEAGRRYFGPRPDDERGAGHDIPCNECGGRPELTAVVSGWPGGGGAGRRR